MNRFWRRTNFWQFLGQALAIVLLLSAFGWLGHNLLVNLRRLGLQFGFNFLRSPAGFGIGEAVIPYEPSAPYWLALLVGLTNSLRVVGLGIVGSTIVGLLAGLARLSDNWLVRQLAKIYIEVLRNTPLLLQLLFWYGAVFLALPVPGQPLVLLGGLVQLSKAGVVLFGLSLSSEFSALLLGLTLYTGTFIAEIVRGGIQSVPRGQWEAARSLGLSAPIILRKIILPQALRSMIPSLANQYLNLSKNSSLAIAIGYPDLYATASTTFNQTGRAVEVMILISLTYLMVSLLISLLLNWYNQRMQFVVR
jgi:general L-amino acid transport system permease protein